MRGALQNPKQLLSLWAPVPLSACLGTRLDQAFGILMYHRVTARTPGVCRPTWNVTPRRFESQLAGLLRRGYRACSLRKVLDDAVAGRPLPRKTFVVTFDDGYENVYRHAWPVLNRLEVPATVFVATAYLDGEGPFPFDDWPAAGSDRVPAESWKPLSTAQCTEMQKSGCIEMGAHTHTHADFRGRPEALRQDLLDCLKVLSSRFGVEEATFAFPFGKKREGFSGPELAAAAKQAGVLCSLTTEGELVIPGTDPFDWGRFTAEEHDTGATLAAKLNGWYTLLRGTWRGLRRMVTTS